MTSPMRSPQTHKDHRVIGLVAPLPWPHAPYGPYASRPRRTPLPSAREHAMHIGYMRNIKG
jgi:hypothetical protein